MSGERVGQRLAHRSLLIARCPSPLLALSQATARSSMRSKTTPSLITAVMVRTASGSWFGTFRAESCWIQNLGLARIECSRDTSSNGTTCTIDRAAASFPTTGVTDGIDVLENSPVRAVWLPRPSPTYTRSTLLEAPLPSRLTRVSGQTLPPQRSRDRLSGARRGLESDNKLGAVDLKLTCHHFANLSR